MTSSLLLFQGLLCAALAVETNHALDAHAALDAGDLAWGMQDRPSARARWLEAAQSDDPAVIAMAELRLLLVSGNLGLVIHGPRADRALARCPPANPWCEIAGVDYLLFPALIGLPSDPKEAEALSRRAARRLPGPATARLVMSGEEPVSTLIGRNDLDGLGQTLLDQGGRWPSGPGTWVLGLSPVAATGLGLGAGIGLHHPDLHLQGTDLNVGLSLTSALYASADLGLRGPGPDWWGGAISAGRLPVGPGGEAAGFGALVLRRGWSRERLESSAGLITHIEAAESLEVGNRLGVGPLAAVTWPIASSRRAPGRSWLKLGGNVESALWSYSLLDLGLDLRGAKQWGSIGLFCRGTAEWAPIATGAPVSRLPLAGGGPLLRSGSFGAWRDHDAESLVVELRSASTQLVEGVVFVEGARIEGLHGGFGAGLRLNLPPRPHATTRLDLAWGDGGLGITAGLGEAF